MVDKLSQKRTGDPTETAEAQLSRLAATNARLQADLDQRLALGSQWPVERVLLKAIINQVPEQLYAKDTKGRFVAANDVVARDNGLQRAEDLIGKTDFDLFLPKVAQDFFDVEQQIMVSGQPKVDVEVLWTDATGRTRWLLTTKVPMRDDRGEIVGLIGMARDITERKRAEETLKAERVLFRGIVDQVPDYLFAKDTASRFVVANRAVAADLGLKPEDLIGKTDFELHPTDLARRFFADEQAVISSHQPMIDIEEFVVSVGGEKKWLSTSKIPLRNEHGEVIGIVGVSRDITERKRAEDQIHFMAHHDSLTGLPNRILLMDRLTQAILFAQRNGGRVTTIFIDLDNFKLVNDSLGHNAGDALLKAVAGRMVACVRATDTVVRLGGDEFVILLIDQTGGPAASAIVDKIRAAIGEPLPIEGQLLHVTCSMGVATFPEDGTDADKLLMNADVAMYQAKAQGRDNSQFYTAEMNVSAHEKRVLQESLRGGLARKEFALVYQPQVDLQSGHIFAVEALVRWHHPELGIVAPAKFIPMAEESGLIVQLGDWVLREACRQNKAWQDAGMAPITVCVNVSARQFRDKAWVRRVADALAASGLDAKYLELELTESLLMQDVQSAIATMRELQAIGVQFSIDDFGTGYSSLSALKSFPVARLKIDQSFVRNLPYDANDRSIATAVISLGQKLNMKVIAEGVETDEQMAFLTEHECDEIQGYHFSKPIESDAVAAMLKAQVKTA